MIGTHWKLKSYTGGEGVGKISNISEGLWLEKCWGRGEEGEG